MKKLIQSNSDIVELLAPAGNMECLRAAINAGADAVYLAGPKFGARAYAGNFTTEELVGAIGYAHVFGVKIYLTVNTLIKEREIDELTDYIAPFYRAGLDGVIIQDLGAAFVIRENFPGLLLCASTQMTLTGPAGARMMADLGFYRAILARELGLKEIREITHSIPIETEVFIHGAMCYCYSGQCLFSSTLGERSANRGRCAGPCRMEYSHGNYKNKYLLSLKDMVTIDHIPDLLDAGVKSLKIEGRMKPPEYVAGITSVYRKYIDKYYELKASGKSNITLKIDKKDREILNKVYIRSKAGPGYLYTKNGSSMISLDSPAYTPSDEQLLNHIKETIVNNDKKLPISIFASIYEGSPANLNISLLRDSKNNPSEIAVNVNGDLVQCAKNAPLTKEAISSALTKLGNTYFTCEDIFIETDNKSFMPKSALNDLRREGINLLYEEMLRQYK